MLAYCGIDCTECSYQKSHGCKGCQECKGDMFHGECKVTKCAIARGNENCSKCDDFPCSLLIDFSLDETHGDGGLRIRNLCKESGKSMMGTKLITQVGILVHDIEATSTKWAEFLGVPVPKANWTDNFEVSNTNYKGNDTPARSKLAFFNCGQLQIELIQPDENPSTWRECLDKNGEGIHHIALWVKGIDKKIKLLEAHGTELVQTGQWIGGRYAYVDCMQTLKIVLELLQNDNP